jgi:DDE superfamily endonuclease
MRWPRPLKKLVLPSSAVRSGASICAKACAGVTRIVGARAMIQTSSQKNTGRLPLHRAARGVDDESRTDELGPVVPRTFPPAPGWSASGHRIKAPLDYSRGPEKTWVYGALGVRDGKELTRCAASRNSTNYISLLADIEADNATGDIYMITDNLSSHSSAQTRSWMAEHPRLHHVFIPKGACWLNLQEGWWRLFRRDAASWSEFCQCR